MSWLSTGTAKVVNGSTRVEFAGVDLIANKVQAGDAFAIRGSFNNEIARVVSATVLELVYPWISASADGAAYTIQPTVARINDLTIDVGELLRTFTDVRDLAGRGIFGDGTVASPGMRFASDQDTGARRAGENVLSLVTGGVDRLLAGSFGATVIGRMTAAQADTVGVAAPTLGSLSASSAFFSIAQSYGLLVGTFGNTGHTWMQAQRIDGNPAGYDLLLQPSGGHLLVGATSNNGYGGAHRLSKAGGEGATILSVDANTGPYSTVFIGVSQGGYSSALAAQWVGRGSTTGRSINAGGTINASGADYAEYMVKAAGCGIIAKGDVCGVDQDGRLTKTWADAVSFVIKSTDPSLVGGDTWDAEVGPKPDEPGAEPAEPSSPAPPAEDADDAAIAAWRDAMAAYPAQIASYQAARAEWQKATDAYAKALPVWEAAHEKARQCVDRIAFCGQVPANVSGDFEVGDYIVAAASGAGIKAVAVKADDMTLAQYMRRIGKVWAIRDGRAWIDVQHG